MKKTSGSVGDWLAEGESPLARLLARARRLQRLEERLHAALEPALAMEVRVVALEDGLLTLVTPRAGVAARLRLEGPAISRALQGSGAGRINEVKVRVAPLPVVDAGERRRRELPATAREALERFARDNGYDDLEEMLQDQESAGGK